MALKKRRERSTWVKKIKKWLLSRVARRAYEHLSVARAEGPGSYRNFVRMDAATFEELLVKVAPLITRKDTKMRQCIHPGE